ncbi:MAG: TetR/AcrR family transcriptional regulator [Caulobacterales bacterium]
MSRGEQRRIAFLQAASDVFLEQGYEAASVNEVVRRAGGSLATLYSQFGNKDGLFWAMIEDATARFGSAMKAEAEDDDRPLREGLQAIGEEYLGRMLEPRGLAMFRVMVGEAKKFPEIARRFFKLGPDHTRSAVAAYLMKRGPAEGVTYDQDSADLDAAFFCEMIRSRHHYRMLWDELYQVTEEDQRAHVTAVVDRFLNGVLPR